MKLRDLHREAGGCLHCQTIRQTAEATIEQLLALVDRLDGDADLEDTGDDEPSLGALERHPDCMPGDSWRRRHQRDGAHLAWSAGSRDDAEDEHDGREDDADDELTGDEEEPSLGSFDRLTNQEHGWRQTGGRHWIFHLNGDQEVDNS